MAAESLSLRRWSRRGFAAGLLGLLALAALGFHGDDPPKPPTRVPWTTSRVVGTPDPPPPYKAVNAFPNVKLHHPLLITRAGDRPTVRSGAGGEDRLLPQPAGREGGPLLRSAEGDQDPQADAERYRVRGGLRAGLPPEVR